MDFITTFLFKGFVCPPRELRRPVIFISGVFLLVNVFICDGVRESVSVPSKTTIFDVSMPNVRPTQNDHYLCSAKDINSLGTQYIHKFEPNSNADRAHHMLLFTCDDVPYSLTKDGWWDCGHHYQACKTMRIVYAWAKNAAPTILPKDVGFRIGAESNIKFLVLQVHYAHPLPEGQTDQSGFRVHLSPDEPTYLAGVMLMFRSYLNIPPRTEKIHGDMNCPLLSNRPIHPFAFRVHTHKLGSVVAGYVIDKNNEITEIGKGNPQWPQAFYPLKRNITVLPMDYLIARCTFTTVDFDKTTIIGQTAGDEMCNLYTMFYTDSRDPEDHFITCGDETDPQFSKFLPADSDVPLPRNKTLEEHAKGSHSHTTVKKPSVEDAYYSKKKIHAHAKKRPGIEFNSYLHSELPQYSGTYPGNDYTEDQIDDGNRVGADRQLAISDYRSAAWPDSTVRLGQASGVDFDTSGNVVVFHRGDRVWGHGTFDNKNRYMQKSLGPISSDTVFIIDPKTGKLLHTWGKNMFYMPHDITVDTLGNFWLTDVALHQVFKFEPGSNEPSLVLGKKFEPGSDDDHFCKPAAVSVMSNGDFFVADGYCNTRIIKFDRTGRKMMQFGRGFQPNLLQSFLNNRPPPYAFYIPHALALAEEKNLICVADRENGRIQCFSASNGTYAFMIESPAFGGRLFSVAYSEVDGGTLYAVNGQNGGLRPKKVQGFIIPLSTRSISGVFSPNNNGFGQPHDIAVTRNGSEVYVVEITKPYKVWKFDKTTGGRTGKEDGYNSQSQSSSPVQNNLGPKEPEKITQQTSAPPNSASNSHESVFNNLPDESQPKREEINDDSFSASVIIMAFLTIPLLLLIGIGALLRLRNNGCCRRKETKSFAEFFPPSAGFEKLRMEESESENSDTEVEEFTVSSYRKTSA